MQNFSGNLAAGQLAWSHEFDSFELSAATGLFAFDADRGDPDAARLLSGNGFRDYMIWNSGARLKTTLGGRALALGVDVFHNGEDYPAAEPARAEDTGYVLSAAYGNTDKPGQWLAGYYYARVEELSVNNSFAQDDWVRWGSATQTRASNFKGHELRFGLGLPWQLNLVARLYLVEAITTVEDGNRFRVDVNFRF